MKLFWDLVCPGHYKVTMGHHLLLRSPSSVQFSHSVVSDSLWPRESQPGLPVHHQLLKFTQTHVHQVGHAIQPSVVPFSSCPQSLPASESFPMSQLFAWSGQSIGVSALASVLPMNTQDWSPLDGLVGSPCSIRDSQESSPTPQFKSINSLGLSFLHRSPNWSLNHWALLIISIVPGGFSLQEK